jgi:hypothetical protein
MVFLLRTSHCHQLIHQTAPHLIVSWARSGLEDLFEHQAVAVCTGANNLRVTCTVRCCCLLGGEDSQPLRLMAGFDDGHVTIWDQVGFRFSFFFPMDMKKSNRTSRIGYVRGISRDLDTFFGHYFRHFAMHACRRLQTCIPYRLPCTCDCVELVKRYRWHAQ